MNASFKVGIAREKITPPLGTVLYGYPNMRRAESTHDDLNLTAYAFSSGERSVLMISADICVLGEDEATPLRKMISAETGVAFENITFSATHTHSGPCTRFSAGWGEKDTEFLNLILKPAAIKASIRAVGNMQEAEMGVGCGESLVGINRRERCLDGAIALGQNPYGIFNKDMNVISFRSTGGKLIGSIVHYGAHNTASGATPVITRDWSGVMVDALERETGALATFFSGPTGDTGPRLSNGKTTGNIDLMVELGKKAGEDAVRIFNSITEWKAPTLNVISDTLRIPYEPLMKYEKAKELLCALLKKAPYEELYGRDKKAAKKYMDVIAHYEKNLPDEDALYLKVTAISLDDLVFCQFPFEVFGEIGLRIAAHSPYAKSLILNNTNGSLAYFPTKSEIAVGGYEVQMFSWFQTYTPVADSDTVAVNEYVRILNNLKLSSE